MLSVKRSTTASLPLLVRCLTSKLRAVVIVPNHLAHERVSQMSSGVHYLMPMRYCESDMVLRVTQTTTVLGCLDCKSP